MERCESIKNHLVWLLSIALMSIVLSCGDAKSGTADGNGDTPMPTNEEVEAMYAKYVSGDYAGYVALMQSVDGKPDTYRSQMVDLYKQQARLTAETNGPIKSYTVLRLEPHDGGKMINAFISVLYANLEEPQAIMVPMVFDGKCWRLR